jgi:hypothetical protein
MCQQPCLPGLISTAIPAQYQGHHLLQGMPFFTLPNALLDSIVQRVGRQRFDTDLLDMERTLSNRLGDSTSNVGYWREIPVDSILLRPMPMQFSDSQIAEFAAENGLNVTAVRRALAVGDDRLQWAVIAQRGYGGWLMTNRPFLDDMRRFSNAGTTRYDDMAFLGWGLWYARSPHTQVTLRGPPARRTTSSRNLSSSSSVGDFKG